MSCLSYNCHGACGDATVREVRELAKEYAPKVVCLLETQLHKKRVEGLARTLGFDNAFAVSSSGRSGGLGVFWNNKINLEILPYFQYLLPLYGAVEVNMYVRRDSSQRMRSC
jgi:exonuclease III